MVPGAMVLPKAQGIHKIPHGIPGNPDLYLAQAMPWGSVRPWSILAPALALARVQGRGEAAGTGLGGGWGGAKEREEEVWEMRGTIRSGVWVDLGSATAPPQ